MEVIIFFAVLYSIVCALFCAKLAKSKGYDNQNWFAAGLFFNVIGLIAAAGLPDRKKPNPST